MAVVYVRKLLLVQARTTIMRYRCALSLLYFRDFHMIYIDNPVGTQPATWYAVALEYMKTSDEDEGVWLNSPCLWLLGWSWMELYSECRWIRCEWRWRSRTIMDCSDAGRWSLSMYIYIYLYICLSLYLCVCIYLRLSLYVYIYISRSSIYMYTYIHSKKNLQLVMKRATRIVLLLVLITNHFLASSLSSGEKIILFDVKTKL